jgi:hypothetical protein
MTLKNSPPLGQLLRSLSVPPEVLPDTHRGTEGRTKAAQEDRSAFQVCSDLAK